MSKKKFTIGLESLFEMATEETFQEESPLLDKKKKKKAKKVDQSGKKRPSKDFSSDLNILFEQAFAETIEERQGNAKNKILAPSKAKQKRKRGLSGLDALIRHTEDMDVVEVNVPTKKRVTFVFDKEKLIKLKEIAKMEKAYLKDIVGDVVSNFIEKYEKENEGLL